MVGLFANLFFYRNCATLQKIIWGKQNFARIFIWRRGNPAGIILFGTRPDPPIAPHMKTN